MLETQQAILDTDIYRAASRLLKLFEERIINFEFRPRTAEAVSKLTTVLQQYAVRPETASETAPEVQASEALRTAPQLMLTTPQAILDTDICRAANRLNKLLTERVINFEFRGRTASTLSDLAILLQRRGTRRAPAGGELRQEDRRPKGRDI